MALISILNIKVSQGSVVTRLRSDGIFNDQVVTQSLLSPKVKEFWIAVNIGEVMGKSKVSFFYSNGVVHFTYETGVQVC